MKENRPITNLRIDIPVIGQISNDSIEFGENSAKAALVMDYMKQVWLLGYHNYFHSNSIELEVTSSKSLAIIHHKVKIFFIV